MMEEQAITTEEGKMNGATTLSLGKGKTVYKESVETRRIEINLDRIAAWTLIFTNTFFVSYFLAKLVQWV
jgi:hypothetical protein